MAAESLFPHVKLRGLYAITPEGGDVERSTRLALEGGIALLQYRQKRRDVALARAIARLGREFHVPVEFFAYPSGRFDREVEKLVRRAGFDAATTTVEGLARPSGDPYALDRVRVSGGVGVLGLAATLRALHA